MASVRTEVLAKVRIAQLDKMARRVAQEKNADLRD